MRGRQQDRTRNSSSTQTVQEANFDRVARLYRWAEYLALGPLLKRTREQYLRELGATKHALVLGDGDGRFTAALLRHAAHAHVHAVDSSAAMLRLLQARCARDGHGDRLATQHATVEEAHATEACDLIATHFLIDCLSQSEVDRLVHRLATEVQPGCRWLISEFGQPRAGWARLLGAAYIRALYLAFGLLTGLRTQSLPNPQPALTSAGFQRLARTERLQGLLYAELWVLRQPRPNDVNSTTLTRGLSSTSE